jgi:hypothetical protein
MPQSRTHGTKRQQQKKEASQGLPTRLFSASSKMVGGRVGDEGDPLSLEHSVPNRLGPAGLFAFSGDAALDVVPRLNGAAVRPLCRPVALMFGGSREPGRPRAWRGRPESPLEPNKALRSNRTDGVDGSSIGPATDTHQFLNLVSSYQKPIANEKCKPGSQFNISGAELTYPRRALVMPSRMAGR